MKSTTRWILAVILVATVGGATLISQIAQAHDTTPTPDPVATLCDPASVPSGHRGHMMTPGTGPMLMTPGAGMAMRQEFDLMFIDMMIPHHESAVAMAAIAVHRAVDSGVRDFAREIMTNEQTEIDQLRTWRDAWYPGAGQMSMQDNWAMMLGMMQGMPGMPQAPYSGSMGPGGMMGMMDPATQTAALCAVTGSFDRFFVQMMIPHHELATVMARVAVLHAKHAELRAFAEQTLETETHEIEQMHNWLSHWDTATPVAANPDIIEVHVTLTDFAVASDITTFAAGQTYRFVVHNNGAVQHEFMVMPHMEGMETMTMDVLDAMSLGMIHADHLPPGATATLDVVFTVSAATGELELVCALPGHYAAGMTLPITVEP